MRSSAPPGRCSRSPRAPQQRCCSSDPGLSVRSIWPKLAPAPPQGTSLDATGETSGLPVRASIEYTPDRTLPRLLKRRRRGSGPRGTRFLCVSSGADAYVAAVGESSARRAPCPRAHIDDSVRSRYVDYRHRASISAYRADCVSRSGSRFSQLYDPETKPSCPVRAVCNDRPPSATTYMPALTCSATIERRPTRLAVPHSLWSR